MTENELREEANQEEFREETAPAKKLPEYRILLVIAVLLGAVIFFQGVAALLFSGIAWAAGWPVELLTSGSLPADADAGLRWQFRLLLGMSHLFSFIIAGLFTAWLFFRSNLPGMPDWRDYLKIRRIPAFSDLGWGIALLIAALPMVLYCYGLNKMIPLPESLRQMESSTNDALKVLLVMNSPLELIANLTLIAVLPAIGEEIVFRGILQQQLIRRFPVQPVAAILLASIIFSAFHLQFEGFLPRMMLGFLLGWIFWRAGNLWVPVAAHFFNNAAQVFAQYLYGQEVSAIDLEQDIDVHWSAALISLLLTIYFGWKIRMRE